MKNRFCPNCLTELKDGAGVCPACGSGLDQTNEPHRLPVDTVLSSPAGESYVLGRVLGAGGFGVTYKGRALNSGRMVAVKEYFPVRCQPQRFEDGSVCPSQSEETGYQHGLRSFQSEAGMLDAAGYIRSAVQVLDYFEANGTAYMVMEFLDGTTLQRLTEKQGKIPFDTLMEKMLPLMRDMAALNETGVLHRDIAPDNIMLMPDGSLKLLDFGCARSMEDGRSMTVMLKSGFAPLEQYTTRGQGSYTDLYALCATIYYCATGQVPPAAPERLDGKPLTPPSELGVSIRPEEEKTLLWGLGIQPKTRPQTIGEFLNAWPAPEPDPVPDPDAGDKIRQFFENNKLLVGIVGGAIVLLLLSLGLQ